MSSFPWLTFVIFLPLVGAALCFAVKEQSARWVALGVTVADFLLSLPLWWLFDSSNGQMQFVERATWIVSPPIYYSLGLDGISLPLVIMTTFLMPLCVTVSWTAVDKRVQTFMAMVSLPLSANILIDAESRFSRNLCPAGIRPTGHSDRTIRVLAVREWTPQPVPQWAPASRNNARRTRLPV